LQDRNQTFLQNNFFPADLLPENFKHWKDIALATTTDAILNVSTERFVTLMAKEDDNYTLEEMSLILKAIETLPYLDVAMYALIHKMPMDRGTYLAFKQEANEATQAFNDIVKPEYDKANRELEAKSKIIPSSNSITRSK